MDPSTMYLTAFTIIGGIIFLVLFFHYVPLFPMAVCQSFRSQHITGSTISDAYS